jgi:peroxiredoxin
VEETKQVRRIEFLTWDGCSSSAEARELLDRVLDYFDVPAVVDVINVETPAQAEELRFPGSPTIRIDGVDVDPVGAEGRPSLSCRIYRRPNGTTSPLPSEFQIQAALRLSLPGGSPAPDFDLPGVDGAHHRLGDYADRQALVLIQSCNHCPFVQAWENRINAVARDYADRGVAVVAVCSNDAEAFPEDSFEEMVKRAEEKKFAFDYLHDEEQRLARALGATRTPEVFVFDRDRRLAYHGTVDDSRDDEGAVTRAYLRDAVDAVLADREPAITETSPQGCFVKWRRKAPAAIGV